MSSSLLTSRRFTSARIISTALALLLSACVANQATPPPRGVVVSGPPPAPVAEDRPLAPGPSAAWVAGYWHWAGMHYAWIPGHWENAPPGQTWAAPQYVSRDGGYLYEPGGWRGQTPPPNRANALR